MSCPYLFSGLAHLRIERKKNTESYKGENAKMEWIMLILVAICRLTEHATNKHTKTLEECFPGFVATPEVPKKK
jgi:hypothetical protein